MDKVVSPRSVLLWYSCWFSLLAYFQLLDFLFYLLFFRTLLLFLTLHLGFIGSFQAHMDLLSSAFSSIGSFQSFFGHDNHLNFRNLHSSMNGLRLNGSNYLVWGSTSHSIGNSPQSDSDFQKFQVLKLGLSKILLHFFFTSFSALMWDIFQFTRCPQLFSILSVTTTTKIGSLWLTLASWKQLELAWHLQPDFDSD